jgi:ribosomal protein S1
MDYRNRMYSEVEEEFVEGCLVLGMRYNIKNSEIANYIAPLLGRTKIGVERKLSKLKNSLQEEKEEGLQVKNPTRRFFSKEDIGNVYTVEVKVIYDHGAVCEADDGRAGFLLIGMITNRFVTDIHEYIRVGDRIEIMVIQDKRNESDVLLSAKDVGDVVAISQR